MISPVDRYKKAWFDKRISQNSKIKSFLIKKIWEHKEKHFPWTKAELRALAYEDLFEIAIAAANKKISIDHQVGSDWTFGADGKVSVVRKNGKNNSYYSALISGCGNKHFILALVFETITGKFYYFAFPATVSQHSVPFVPNTGQPKTDNYMWEKYNYETFEVMAAQADTWQNNAFIIQRVTTPLSR